MRWNAMFATKFESLFGGNGDKFAAFQANFLSLEVANAPHSDVLRQQVIDLISLKSLQCICFQFFSSHTVKKDSGTGKYFELALYELQLSRMKR